MVVSAPPCHLFEAVFEARNEPALADHDVDVGRRAAIKRLAVDLADEVDLHLVAVLGERHLPSAS